MTVLIDALTNSSGKVIVDSNDDVIAFTLPDGYAKLPYLESDGTAYINTGFVPDTKDFKHTLVFSVCSGQTGQKYICGTGVQEGRSGNLRINSRSLDGLYINKSSAKSILSGTQVLTVDTRYKVVMDLHNNATNSVKLNSTSVVNSTTGTIDSSRPMYLFALSASYVPTYVRIYSSVLKQVGIPIYYLIPARRASDQVIGMYDVIQKRFLTNAASSGKFLTGNSKLAFGTTNANIVERCNYTVIDDGNGVVVNATSTYGRASFTFPVVTNGQQYRIDFDAEAEDGYKMIYFHNAAFNPGDGWDPVYGTMSVAAGGHFTKTITSSSNVLWIGIYASATTTTGKITLKNVTVTQI